METYNKQSSAPLTSPVFYILLVLSIKEMHGYEIMKRVEEESKGKIKLGPGTLYTAIKRLLDANFIQETADRPQPEYDDERRKYYQITDKGRSILGSELERFSSALTIANKYHVFHLVLGYI